MFCVNISISPASLVTLARVQYVKKGNPNVSTVRCRLMLLVDLYGQKPLDLTLTLQVFCTACKSMTIEVVQLTFLHALAHLSMKNTHQYLDRARFAPLNASVNTRLNRAVGLWASPPSCSHFSDDFDSIGRAFTCSSIYSRAATIPSLIVRNGV